MRQEPKPCIFCGERNAKSDEDAWSVWLMNLWREVTGSKKAFFNELVKGRIRDRNVVRDWHGVHKVSGICEPCNTQWMSRCENNAKSLLVPMILGSEPAFLGPAEQKTLARWAYLKMLVFALSTPNFEIPVEEYRRFKHSRKPQPGSLILLSAVNPGYPGNLFRFDPVTVIDSDGSTAPNYRCTFLLGHVFLQVFGRYPGRQRMQSRSPIRASDPEHSPRIWRPEQRVITFPPPKHFDPGQIEGLLEVLYNPGQRAG